MPADPDAEPALSPVEAAQVASLDAVTADLQADAQSWARQLGELAALAARAEQAGPQTRRTLALELAGSWRVGQLTAERWIAEAERFHDALPLTLSLMGAGALLRHQGAVLLHELAPCTPDVAQAVEAEVLPAGGDLCPTDLRRRVRRVRLRIESEAADVADLERQELAKQGRRRTWMRPTEDGMAVAGALLTPEQGVAWAAGMDALERRERLADRAAGIDRTAEQRRADLFASLPALVLAGTAADDAHRRAAGLPTGGRVGPPMPEDPQEVFEELLPPLPPWSLLPEQVAARITLNVHVPVSTVLELSKEPGRLDGYGPVSAEHVRLVRPHSYRRVMVDATSGRPIAMDDRPTPAADTPEERREQITASLRPGVVVDRDEPRHDPSARLARLIDLRDVHCCGPGCSSTRTDRDHLQPWPVGPTSARNLGLASPRCHSAKHHGWTLIRHGDGSVTWRSPLHRHYDRPGPWAPPPAVDLWAEPPPLREQPQPPVPEEDDDLGLLERLDARTPSPQQGLEQKPEPPTSTCHGWPDDPQF